MVKRCRLVCDTAAGAVECKLNLPDEATVGMAIDQARAQLSDLPVDWGGAPVGVFGQACSRDHILADGDRVEVYRPLLNDPRQARRARAERAPDRRVKR